MPGQPLYPNESDLEVLRQRFLLWKFFSSPCYPFFNKGSFLFVFELYQKYQGWISDMGIDYPTFVPKSGYFLQIWVKVCPQSWLFLNFLANFTSWLFDEMLALSNKKSTFVLVSGFLGCCIMTILFKYYLKSRF